jgi:anionic cell wall polymer biosynthesis LytR-Cps2A-Psr (LCP) family protein
MARYGLDLERKNKFDSKSKRTLIIVFVCFCLVLGVASTLLLWRSLNYDFNNIFGDTVEVSTLPQNEELTEAPTYEGTAVFFLCVTSDDKTAVRFINLISVDLFEKTIRVVPVDANKVLTDGQQTLANAVIKQSREYLITEAEKVLYTEIDRYVILTETSYKSVFNVFGDVDVFLEEEVAYDTEDMFLELKRGKNTLTPEKAYKYMKYVSSTYSGLKAAEKNADVIVAAFSTFYTLENNANAENIFTKIINYCETDISIVDFINVKDKAGSIIPASNKEKLRVYVAATVTGGDLYAEEGNLIEE